MSDIDHHSSPIEHPHLTADLPGVGGQIKQRPEDFLVEEQPLYEPTGEGEHLYLFVEKTGLTTDELVRAVAKAFRVNRRSVGYAGLKDKHAITRQHLSLHLPGGEEDDAKLAANLEHHPRIKLLWATRHANKLRRGHLAGNRFVIRIREVSPTGVVHAKRVLDALSGRGVPNYIGAQRFGYRHNSHDLGRLFLLGRYDAMLEELLGRAVAHESDTLIEARQRYREGDLDGALELWPRTLRHDRQALDALRRGESAHDAVLAIDRRQLEFLTSAFQSAVFNDVLAQRLMDGTFDRLVPGDLAFKHENRACFAVDEATAAIENAPGGRIASFAVSPSGPMWGPDMTRAGGAVDAQELAALQAYGLGVEQLTGQDRIAATGSRRPLRIAVKDADLSGGVDEHGPYIRVAFELPRGSYATTVLEEIMKINHATDSDSSDQAEP
jgi:tRNA pseudouridine13 synthase